MNRKNGRVTIFVSALLLLTIILVAANTLVVNNVSAAATSPSLGAAASYSLFGGTGVSCTGGASMTGDVGISPGPATAITGFPGLCTIVSPGANQGGPPGTNAARAAIGAAYTTLAGETCSPGNYPNLGGLVLPPGVYCASSSMSLTGTLTLSGSGVWVFETVSGLTFNPGAKIVGGDPCNVWWQVASQATLDTTNTIIGTIIAGSAIVLNGGSILNGRALAQSSGAVTLASGGVAGPTCATSLTTTVIGTTTIPILIVPPVGLVCNDSISCTLVIPEYPFGLAILAIFMIIGYGVIRRKTKHET
jgi:hypothetical protein